MCQHGSGGVGGLFVSRSEGRAEPGLGRESCFHLRCFRFIHVCVCVERRGNDNMPDYY